MHTLGIDIGKTSMHVSLLIDGRTKPLRRRLDNNDTGRGALIDWLAHKLDAQALVHACLEATGGWEEPVARALHERGHTVSVVNPYRISAYGKSEGATNKTDRTDADRIARFCRSQRPPAWQPPTAAERTLTELVRTRADLKATRQEYENRLDAPRVTAATQASHRRVIATLGDEIAELDRRIDAHIEAHPALRRRRELIVSISGIGKQTAEVLLGEIGNPLRFDSARQLAAWCGVVPCEWSSGTSVRRRPRISKRGNPRIRAALYYPAMSATCHNPVLIPFAERLKANGKQGKQIVVAVMRKLIHLVYGVIKNDTAFDPNWGTRNWCAAA